MLYQEIRQDVLQTTLDLEKEGLIFLTAGNISARCSEEHVAITPSGISYRGMTAEDIIVIDVHGNLVEGRYRPSSEWPMHTLMYREKPGVNAVIHTHSTYAMAFALTGVSVPMVSLESLAARGTIPVARYACPGTEDNGQAALEAMTHPNEVNCVILRNHGVLAVGPDLRTAYKVAYNSEFAAKIYWLALQVGKPNPLTSEQVGEIRATYSKLQAQAQAK